MRSAGVLRTLCAGRLAAAAAGKSEAPSERASEARPLVSLKESESIHRNRSAS